MNKSVYKFLSTFIMVITLMFVSGLSMGISPNPDGVRYAGDEGIWRSIRNEAFSVGDNADCFMNRSLTIVAGDSTDGSKAQKINITSSLKSNTMVRYITIYTNEDCWYRLIGTGINATLSGAGADSTAKARLRADKSETIYAPNCAAITFYSGSASNQAIDVRVGCARIKELTPTQ